MWQGTIPSEVGQLTNLTDLRIARSDQTDRPGGECTSCLNGALPTEVGLLTGLNRLWLFENSLDGAFPTEIGRLTQLRKWHL